MDFEKAYKEAHARFEAFKEKYLTKDTNFGDVLFDKTGEMKKEVLGIFQEVDEEERLREMIATIIKLHGYLVSKENQEKMLDWLQRRPTDKLVIQSMKDAFKCGQNSKPDPVKWTKYTGDPKLQHNQYKKKYLVKETLDTVVMVTNPKVGDLYIEASRIAHLPTED